MKSFLFCTSFLQTGVSSSSIRRWQKWLTYYSPRRSSFGASHLVIIDDGSPIEEITLPVSLVAAEAELPRTLPGATLFRFADHSGRQSVLAFPGWWRSFTYSLHIAEEYSLDKIIHVESDAFVLSPEMARYIQDCTHGWTTFWCPRHQQPESAIQVICRDAFPLLEPYRRGGLPLWTSELCPERMLPFTHVDRTFVGDRYGEYLSSIPLSADYSAQTLEEMSLAGSRLARGRSTHVTT